MRQPLFLPGRRGPLFALWFDPDAAGDQAILVVPPFAEELNKSRRMLALQGESLARAGRGLLAVDLHGTGDSAGEFIEADWDTWQSDLVAAAEWLGERGVQRIQLLAVRFGALLAVDFLRHSPLPIAGLTLWQPVVKGAQTLTQFLRLRLAAGMMSGQTPETVSALRQRSAAGEALEVAGYGLSPQLRSAIDAADLSQADPSTLPPVHWMELIASAERDLSPAARGCVAAWRDAGVTVHPHKVVGDHFWATQEIVTVPDLIALTTTLLSKD